MSLAMLGCIVSRKRKPYPIFYGGNPRGVTFFINDYSMYTNKLITPTSPTWPTLNGNPYITDEHVVLFGYHNGRASLVTKTKEPLDFDNYSKCEVAFELGSSSGLTPSSSRPIELHFMYGRIAPVADQELDSTWTELDGQTKRYTSLGTYAEEFDLSGLSGEGYIALKTSWFQYSQWFKITKWRLRR